LVSLAEGDTLVWQFEMDRVRWKKPPHDLLQRFIVLWQKGPKAIIAFAEKWGTLRLDANCAPTHGFHGSEPLDLWVFLSRRAYAILHLANALDHGHPGNEEDWGLLCTPPGRGDVVPHFWGLPHYGRWQTKYFTGYLNEFDYGKAIIVAEVAEWLNRFRVYLYLLSKPVWQLGVHYDGRVLGAIALQLAMTIANSEGLFTCGGCGKLYFRSKQRKPNAGQSNFCQDCVSRRMPQQRAEERYRENRREARRLAAEGVAVAEIANRLNRTTTVIQRWLKSGTTR
jgi:hypothetical protein